MDVTHVSDHSPLAHRNTADAALTDAIRQIIAEVRPYSMVPDQGIEMTIRLTLDAIRKGVAGELVECGTWLGGCSFAMLLAQKYVLGEITQPVRMFDSFQGMSPPTEPDGDHGNWWWRRAQSGEPDPDKQDYCKAPLEKVQEAVVKFGFDNHVMIHPGWFKDTLPLHKPGQIAVLRVDCDWYDPVMDVYEKLVPRVSVGAPIIIDDYYAWEGCVLATHEYLTKHKLPWMIHSAPGFCGAWMIKSKSDW